MSVSPYFYIEVCNPDTQEWEKVSILSFDIKRKEYFPVDVWGWNGTHELFEILGLENSYFEESPFDIHHGLPVNCSDEIKKEYEEFCVEEPFSFEPKAKWFNLADAKLYVKDKPKVIDCEKDPIVDANGDENFFYTDNPVVDLINRVVEILNVWNDCWTWSYASSDVRIICWLV